MDPTPRSPDIGRKSGEALWWGFTLIELLVVVAILGILIALLLPVANRMIYAGKKVACVSNLHNIGIGMQSYIGENNGYLPDNGVADGSNIRWYTRISPYISSFKVAEAGSDPIFHCPLQRRRGNKFYNDKGEEGSIYAGNLWVLQERINAMKLTNSTRLVWVAERAWNRVSEGANTLNGSGPYPQNKYGAAANHRPDINPDNGPDGAATYLFADGHVEILMKWPGTNYFTPLPKP